MPKLTNHINDILDQYDFDFVTADDIENCTGDLTELLQELINEQEIIYYSKAIEYLANEDASLQEACELASDMGYETKNLNSELLATLLYQQRLNEKLSGIVKALESLINE